MGSLVMVMINDPMKHKINAVPSPEDPVSIMGSKVKAQLALKQSSTPFIEPAWAPNDTNTKNQSMSADR